MSRRVWLSLLILPPLLAAGCKRETPQAATPKPPDVQVAIPVNQRVIDYEFFTGRTDPPERVELKSRVTGYLIEADKTKEGKVKYEEGGKVKKGEVLFIIDPAQMQADVAVARANLGLAKARLKRADDDLQRGIELGASISKEEMDKRRADRIEAAEAQTVAETTLARSLVSLAYTKVEAPFDGRISRRLVDPGSTVKADDTILSILVSDGPMYAYFDVDERTLLSQLLKESRLEMARSGKLKVDLGLVDEEGYPHKGTVNFVDNRVDPGTGSKWLRAQFDNANRPLTPGLFVRVRFPIGEPYDAMLVAEQAIVTDQGQKHVYVVDDKNKVEYRRVKTGRLHGGLRVIHPYKEGPGPNDREGIKPDEKIVVSGLQRARAGNPVNPKLVKMIDVVKDRGDEDVPLPPKKNPAGEPVKPQTEKKTATEK